MVELELQAVVWAICKCQIYLQGLPRFDVVVDHKLLELILNNQTIDMIDNPRIQRLKEKVSGYTFQTILKKKEKDHIIPDALSRAPCRDPTQEDLISDENPDSFQRRDCAIFRKEKQSLIDPIIEEIKDSTRVDEESQALIAAIQNDFSSNNLRPSVKPFKKLAHHLAVEDGLIILDGHRIVVPKKERRTILAKLHASHQGTERTKRRARQIFYWPGINSDLQNTIESCSLCQENRPSLQKEPRCTTRRHQDHLKMSQRICLATSENLTWFMLIACLDG